MWRQFGPALRITIFFTVLTGVVYPAVITALCQVFFPWQANGSMIKAGGHIIGSALIGQAFSRPDYFHPRPSAAGPDGYDASASRASNFGPTNQNLIERLKRSIEKFRGDNPGFSGPIPADLVTASGSGLDPDISLASAKAQIPRIAGRRDVSSDQIEGLVAEHARQRKLGFLGEPRVNVLELNLALDRKFPVR